MPPPPPPPSTSQQAPAAHPPGGGHAKKKKVKSAYPIKPISAFYLFLAANLVAAVFAPIQDCDETFNYWEPTHYLSHRYGLQTWEYSPEFTIRSWLYVALHALVGNVRRLLPQSTKVAEFYFVRYGLAVACALSQTILFQAISLTLNGRIGIFFLLITILSPGNFHASTAYLPSSFAMYASYLGAAAFMNWKGGLKTAQGIFWFAFGGVLGWPFAAALCLPFMVEEVVLLFFSDADFRTQSLFRMFRGVVAGTLVIIVDFFVNYFFYRKPAFVSWNIVYYNIFSSSGGPELYGTEPWAFYFQNLALNFNVWFVLALLALPLFLLQKLVRASGQGFQSGLRTIVFVAPFYMWLAIFSAQPHKEERFFYPAYPFLVLNAAISLHILLTALGTSDPTSLIAKIPAKLRMFSVAIVVLLAADVGLLRIYGIYSGYSAPLKIYAPLWGGHGGQDALGHEGEHVCFGKEWYRFPSSYFLPRDMHAKFIRSEFRGLLPGEFSEARTGFGIWSGTWLLPSGMNDRNEEDMSKYVDLGTCSFLVDTQFPEREAPLPPGEPDYVADEETWSIVGCEPFLDAAETHMLARALWVPDLSIVPPRFRRKWGRHCLLQKKGAAKRT